MDKKSKRKHRVMVYLTFDRELTSKTAAQILGFAIEDAIAANVKYSADGKTVKLTHVETRQGELAVAAELKKGQRSEYQDESQIPEE